MKKIIMKILLAMSILGMLIMNNFAREVMYPFFALIFEGVMDSSFYPAFVVLFCWCMGYFYYMTKVIREILLKE